MIKKSLAGLVVSITFILVSTHSASAGDIAFTKDCPHAQPGECVTGYSCQKDPTTPGGFICKERLGIGIPCETTDPDPCIIGSSCRQESPMSYICQKDALPKPAPAQPAQGKSIQDIFGKIDAPAPIAGFLDKNPTGSGAISDFLSRLVALIYVIAAIVLIFMLLWGALEWIVSGGDKEKIAGAQRRIINAIIGIILFALAFAIIQVLGTFTGFKFFKRGVTRSNEPGIRFICPDGTKIPDRIPLEGDSSNDPEIACKGHGT